MASEIVSKQNGNKGGKVALSSKGKGASEMSAGNSSAFDVPENVKAELRAKGLAARWIDMAQLKSKGGYHKSGWTPMSFDCLKGANKANPFMDAAMDGFLVRNGSVLAVNTQEVIDAKSYQLRQRTAIQSGRQASEDFKRHIKSQKYAKIEEDSDESE